VTGVVCGHEIKVYGAGILEGDAYFDVHAQWRGCSLLIAGNDGLRGLEQSPPFRITVPGTMWLSMGHAADTLPAEIMKDMGFEPTQSANSRVDICLDVIGNLGPLCKHIMDGHTVDRNVNVNNYRKGRVYSGVVIHSSSMKIRIYDKLFESGGDEVKLDMLVCNRWGGEMPKHAWRIEIEFHAERLKKASPLRDREQVRKNIQGQCRWAFWNWCRPVAKRSDDAHVDRDLPLPFWAALADFVQLGESEPVEPIKPKAKPGRLMKAAAGTIARAAAWLGFDEPEMRLDPMQAWLREVGAKLGIEIDLAERVGNARRDLIARGLLKRDREPISTKPPELPLTPVGVETVEEYRLRVDPSRWQMDFEAKPYVAPPPSKAQKMKLVAQCDVLLETLEFPEGGSHDGHRSERGHHGQAGQVDPVGNGLSGR
jgi:hypothetical protein